MPLLRKLNDEGVERFQQYISDIVENPEQPVPVALLNDLATSQELPASLTVELIEFPSRMEAASYFHNLLAGATSGLDRDRGVWAWLALYYFDQLCPKGKDGQRKVRELARYVPFGHAWRYYRHLLAGPYLIYKAYRDDPEKARIVLYGPLDTITDFTEQLASRQDIVQNKAAIEAATLLYLNAQSGKPKRGASATTHKPGTLRRFTDLINQLDPTFDLYSMNAVQLLAKLPAEFDAFRL